VRVTSASASRPDKPAINTSLNGRTCSSAGMRARLHAGADHGQGGGVLAGQRIAGHGRGSGGAQAGHGIAFDGAQRSARLGGEQLDDELELALDGG
jgi:hypothetical protein